MRNDAAEDFVTPLNGLDNTVLSSRFLRDLRGLPFEGLAKKGSFPSVLVQSGIAPPRWPA